MPECRTTVFGPPDGRAPQAPVPPWLHTLRGHRGLLVLRDAAVPAPWGAERLPLLVLHRRGGVIVEGRRASSIACLVEGGSAESPCMPVLDAHRRVALLRRHVARRARRLFPRRLFPARFAAGLSFEALVVVDGVASPPAHRTTCAALVPSPDQLARHIEALVHSPASSGPVLGPEDWARLAADLTAGAVADDMDARYWPGVATIRGLGGGS